jgi:hypothetical protein
MLIAPESPERTYRPEIAPWRSRFLGENALSLTQKADPVTGMKRA